MASLNDRNKWKVKDNITITLNVINKAGVKKNPFFKLKTKDDVMKELRKLVKTKGIDILEASELYKREIKSLYNVL